MITAETITDEQIRELRAELAHGSNPEMFTQAIEACTVALWKPLRSFDRMFLNEPYRSAAVKADEARMTARAHCADILRVRETKPAVAIKTIISKDLADEIDVALNRSLKVECEIPGQRNCIDGQLKPDKGKRISWHDCNPKKMCASCACLWHLSAARNYALGVVR